MIWLDFLSSDPIIRQQIQNTFITNDLPGIMEFNFVWPIMLTRIEADLRCKWIAFPFPWVFLYSKAELRTSFLKMSLT